MKKSMMIVFAVVGTVVCVSMYSIALQIRSIAQQTRSIAQQTRSIVQLTSEIADLRTRVQTAPAQQTTANTAAVQTTSVAPSRFQVWKTITLGNYPSVADIRSALKHGRFLILDWSSSTLDKIPLASQATAIDLVKVTSAQLDFPNGATNEEIYAAAKQRGLDLCPAEVGPQLRLAYTDQPMKERLNVGMEPITGLDGHPTVFSVEHNADGLWLSGNWVVPYARLATYGAFVFCLRK